MIDTRTIRRAGRFAARLLAGAVLLISARPVNGQAGGGAGSRAQAARILDRAIEATGGWEAISRAKTFSERAMVIQTRRGQEARPGDAPPPGRPVLYTITADSDLRRLVADGYLADTAQVPVRRVVLSSGSWRMMNLMQGTLFDVPDPTLMEDLHTVATFVPGVLSSARERSRTLRYVEGRGEGEEALAFTEADGTERTLVFSAQSGRLVRMERLEEHPLFGDLTLTVAFDDYRPAGDLVVPYRITTELPGVFRAEATSREVTPGAPLDPSTLVVPEGVRPDPRVSTSGKHSVEPFPGIHHFINVVSAYNMLWVEQDDGVWVIEAPGGLETSEEVLAEVAAQAPGKPVRGFVLTHFHYDHSAGLWTYIERGIPVYTTPGIGEFVDKIAAAPRTLAGVKASPDPAMEMVAGRRMIGSGPNRFELIDAGPNPHAEQILIVYFPERRLLYVPDIYGYYPGYTPPPLLQSFADRLDALNLDIRIVLTAHTEPDSIEGLQRMIRQVREGR